MAHRAECVCVCVCVSVSVSVYTYTHEYICNDISIHPHRQALEHGDIIGVGVMAHRAECFFTRNGVLLGFVPIENALFRGAQAYVHVGSPRLSVWKPVAYNIYLSIYLSIYINIDRYRYVFIHIYIYIYMYVYVYIYIYIYICIYINK